ncbi:MAG: hypothetical protein IJ644_10775 [Oscillospiraceae bacterium]|nr:hypothetical protein [Oscillospiraceae bacterium]
MMKYLRFAGVLILSCVLFTACTDVNAQTENILPEQTADISFETSIQSDENADLSETVPVLDCCGNINIDNSNTDENTDLSETVPEDDCCGSINISSGNTETISAPPVCCDGE